MLEFAVERQIEFGGEIAEVPGGVKRREVIEELLDRHPGRKVLIFGDVADVLKSGAGERGAGLAKHHGAAGGGHQDVHQQLNKRGLAGSIVTHEREDGAPGNDKRGGLESNGLALETVGLGKGGSFDGRGRCHSQWS